MHFNSPVVRSKRNCYSREPSAYFDMVSVTVGSTSHSSWPNEVWIGPRELKPEHAWHGAVDMGRNPAVTAPCQASL